MNDPIGKQGSGRTCTKHCNLKDQTHSASCLQANILIFAISTPQHRIRNPNNSKKQPHIKLVTYVIVSNPIHIIATPNIWLVALIILSISLFHPMSMQFSPNFHSPSGPPGFTSAVIWFASSTICTAFRAINRNSWTEVAPSESKLFLTPEEKDGKTAQRMTT